MHNLILQTAALAQKNSEATRALAIQEEILEKELKEIQKILLGMQVRLCITRIMYFYNLNYRFVQILIS